MFTEIFPEKGAQISVQSSYVISCVYHAYLYTLCHDLNTCVQCSYFTHSVSAFYYVTSLMFTQTVHISIIMNEKDFFSNNDM